jgi:hypothetical protein
MDLSFSHQRRTAEATPRNDRFAWIVATAVARQIESQNHTYNIGSGTFDRAAVDPLRDRITYFSRPAINTNICERGAFLPVSDDTVDEMKNDEGTIYRDASAIGKPRSDIIGLPDLPDHLRGMENRGRND